MLHPYDGMNSDDDDDGDGHDHDHDDDHGEGDDFDFDFRALLSTPENMHYNRGNTQHTSKLATRQDNNAHRDKLHTICDVTRKFTWRAMLK